MSDVGGVQGEQPQEPLTQEEIDRYKEDYDEGFKLFSEGF